MGLSSAFFNSKISTKWFEISPVPGTEGDQKALRKQGFFCLRQRLKGANPVLC